MPSSVRQAPVGRPKDAATLILIDRSAGGNRVLLGQRARSHTFMPGLYVFPGGRRDPGDHRRPFASDLDPRVIKKLLVANRRPMTSGAARFAHKPATSSETTAAAELATLRYVARAITPPGHPRRYDTRFFLTFTDEAGIDPSDICDSRELLDLQWLDIDDISCLNMPDITKTVLGDVVELLKVDPSLGFGRAVPFYFLRRGRFVRHML
jgi:8-oxo-dGTP pyrophosphatase MutT (NUDIX family)